MRIKKLFNLFCLPPIKKQNQPSYDKYGRFIGWFSRSIATAIFVYCKDKNGEWCVLASERGTDAADFKGCWNCTCGYLDFGESTTECACRELQEEVGVTLEPCDLEFMGYEDDPIKANHQNVTFRFRAIIKDKITDDLKFSHKRNEGKEVGDIKWLKLDEIKNYSWAFNHNELIKKYFPKN